MTNNQLVLKQLNITIAMNGLNIWLFVSALVNFQHTVFIHIKAQVFISYKQLLTRHLYEPFPHFIQVTIYLRVLNPCVYSGPGVYMSPAFIRINTALFPTNLFYLHIQQLYYVLYHVYLLYSSQLTPCLDAIYNATSCPAYCRDVCKQSSCITVFNIYFSDTIRFVDCGLLIWVFICLVNY